MAGAVRQVGEAKFFADGPGLMRASGAHPPRGDACVRAFGRPMTDFVALPPLLIPPAGKPPALSRRGFAAWAAQGGRERRGRHGGSVHSGRLKILEEKSRADAQNSGDFDQVRPSNTIDSRLPQHNLYERHC
jgi:hypothetical protein